MNEKDCHTLQKGSCKAGSLSEMELTHWPWQNETDGTNPYQLFQPKDVAHLANQQLQRILAVLPNELTKFEGDLPTYAADVETAIAKCISVCLTDVPLQKRSISAVRSLLRDNKVVVPVQGGNPTVSLHKVHVILQDNFPGSCLCNLMNILLAGWMNTTSKVITFS